MISTEPDTKRKSFQTQFSSHTEHSLTSRITRLSSHWSRTTCSTISQLKESTATSQLEISVFPKESTLPWTKYYFINSKHYKVSGKTRPPTFLLDSHIADRNVYNEDYLDYVFPRLAKQPDNMTKYVFPSMCIGYEGLYRAFQYLQQFKKDSSNSSFLSENFSFEYLFD